MSEVEVTHLYGIPVTSAAQTAYDLATALPFAGGVVAVDSARRERRSAGALVTLPELNAAHERVRRRQGKRRAARVIEFSTTLSDSALESLSRVQIHALGFPAPELQHRLTTDRGTFEADFWFPNDEHWAECDGDIKYTDPSMRKGRTATQVVIDEKNRENEIRRHVTAFSRWSARDAYHPDRIFRALSQFGLPSDGQRLLP